VISGVGRCGGWAEVPFGFGAGFGFCGCGVLSSRAIG